MHATAYTVDIMLSEISQPTKTQNKYSDST